jgi:hypothetical protein
MQKFNCRIEFFLFILFSWSARLQSLNSLRPHHFYMMSLIHTQSTVAFWWEKPHGFGQKNTTGFHRKTSTAFGGKNTTAFGGKNTTPFGGKNIVK